MANLLHMTKSGSNWSQNGLCTHNIVVEYQDTATFFGVNPLPQPPIPAELLHNVAAEDMEDEGNYTLMQYMDWVMNPVPVQTSALNIPLFICDEQQDAKPNVSIMTDSIKILLLVQQDKQDMEAEPQLIAEAIAAFQANNYEQRCFFSQGPIAHKTMPGIVLTGTLPVFYKIPVTTKLTDSVSLGQYLPTRSSVHAHLPPVPHPACHLNEGMRPLDNRVIILSYYEAFKQFVN
ncbi:hypothetical protein EDD18DRAFT_1344678 [Armillaria luteobubalina]|uniref:Uncharacterized protein n=1 Tax=Armillaria luteobubalina TaxID=153913 RepID=A0AA39TYF6_9AGAR|nr:hypothetical protein EDD18DRAFT_1344678 [Armillaria luteobubalina]